MFEFTKSEYLEICEELMLNDEYKKLFEMKIKGYSRTKMYAKRTMDLWCDSKKWKWLAEHSSSSEDKAKYMNVSNMLMELFNKEVESMRL